MLRLRAGRGVVARLAGAAAVWLAAGLAGALINTSMALLVVVLVAERPAALSLVAVVVVMLAVGYRAYLSVVDGHNRLQALYRFVGSTGTASELDDTLRSVL
ncbi:hypothetical protein HLB01_20465, partial [Bordetella trematum]|uniref:hypothetical protein n=1 Tax=Bordetella trematum TaxID=123899 RepID=UPI001478E799